jgi:VanZ family protein
MSNAVLEPSYDQTAERPQAWRWISWGVVAVYWLGMFGGTHWPTPPHGHFGNADKLMHFSAYFGLAVLVSIALGMRRPVSLAVALGVVALLAGYGALDELTQPLVGRDCELLDWCADASGIVLGTCCFLLGAFTWRRRPGRAAH